MMKWVGVRMVRLPVLVVLVFGTSATLFLYRVLENAEWRTVERDFHSAASERGKAVGWALEDVDDHLYSVRSFLSVTGGVDRNKFRQFVAPFLTTGRGVLSIEWIPRVPAAMRGARVQAARRDGLTNFSFEELSLSGQCRLASDREEYYPVFYSESQGRNQKRLGLDLATETHQWAAMCVARDQGRPEATVMLPAEPGSTSEAIRVFMPVWNREARCDTAEARREALVGFAGATINLQQLVEETLDTLSPVGIKVRVSTSTTGNLISASCFHGDCTWASSRSTWLAWFALSGHELVHTATIAANGQQWNIECSSVPEFIAARRTWWAGMMVIAGLICTLLLAVTVRALIGRGAEVRRLVEVRTRELTESEQRARSIFESVQTGILVIDAQTHEILDVNVVAATLIGRAPEDIRGKICHQFICPADCGNCPITDLNQTVDRSERLLLTADGRQLPIFKSVVPIDLYGRSCLLESFLDISQRKRAEEELARSERRLSLQNHVGRVFLTASDDALYVEVLQLVCEAVGSDLGAFGYIDEDGSLVLPTLQGKVWERCEMPDKRLRFARNTWGESLWGRAILDQRTMCRNEASTVPFGHVAIRRSLSVPIVDHGQTVGILMVANKATDYDLADRELLEAVAAYTAPGLNARLQRDIQERKRQHAEEQLKEYAVALRSANRALEEFYHVAESATRAKSEFLANMSHEIRTPMTSILGYADLLLESRFSEEEQHSHLQTIRHNGEILLNLINDILDLSKIEAERMVVDRIECSPIEVVEDVLSLLSVRAAAKGLELTAGYAYPLPATIRTDPLRLRQILVNLVGNAIKFTEQGKVQIFVRCISSPENTPRMEWTVCDTGIGLDPKDLPRLFQPFSQVDSSAKRRCGGSGLGLAISKRLAELLGGTIVVRSELGRGSSFTLSIDPGPVSDVPTVDGATVAATETSAIPPDHLPTLSGRVLLAEDGPDNQRLIGLILGKAGLEVELAENGRIAFEKAMASHGDRPFDLILMDIQMPECDGYQATRMLRQAGWKGPVIALTAHAMVGDREKCIAAGCDSYTTKPVDRHTLLATIARFLNAPEQEAANIGSDTHRQG